MKKLIILFVILRRVTCWSGEMCQAVQADPINYEQNKIVGNKVVRLRK
jgi:hypothetical protein